MSNFIVEEEHGTYTGRRHPSNGYYAFTGPTTRTSGPRHLAPTYLQNRSCHFAPLSGPARSA
jgi:hypothetical protein